mgnify:CR=1 FL=1
MDERGTRQGRPPRGSGRGFTLIETLVAISILAVSLTVLMQLFSGGLKSSRLSDEYTRGIFYARERMDEILLARQLSAGIISGEYGDGYKWRAEAAPLPLPGAKDVRLPLQGFTVNVSVSWETGGREKQFALSAIKLVEAAPENPR